MKYIKITGPWCNITYTPVSKRDNGVKFLKALRRVQLTRAKTMETKKHPMKWSNEYGRWSRQNLLVNPKEIGLKVEIVH